MEKDVLNALNISQATAVLLVRDMLKDGLMARIGNGRHARYTKEF